MFLRVEPKAWSFESRFRFRVAFPFSFCLAACIIPSLNGAILTATQVTFSAVTFPVPRAGLNRDEVMRGFGSKDDALRAACDLMRPACDLMRRGCFLRFNASRLLSAFHPRAGT